MKALPLSDKAHSFLKPGCGIYISTPNGSLQKLQVRSLKYLHKHVIISFEGIDAQESASRLRDAFIYVEEGSVELGKGEYLVDEITGLSVFDEDGVFVGKISEIFWAGSHDVYVIRNGEREFLLPAVKEFITHIDLEEKKMIIHPIAGLLD